MEEKRTKVVISIPWKPRPPKPTTACPAAFSAASPSLSPAPRFITTFDPSEPIGPAAAPAIVIAPLPDSRRLSTVLTDGGPASDDNNPASSSAGYGLPVRDKKESKRRKLAAQDDASVRRFKQDMAALPDIQGADEYDEVPVEGFGAALLAGYGWKEGNAIGRDKSKGDSKVVEPGRRSDTNGLGADPLDKTHKSD